MQQLMELDKVRVLIVPLLFIYEEDLLKSKSQSIHIDPNSNFNKLMAIQSDDLI